MLSWETIFLFITASSLLALAPGPDNIFVMTQSMVKGAKPGIFVTLGLCSGLVVHTLAVAFGVAAIFQTSVLAFNILKYIGAAYLVYLAYLSFKASSASKIQADKSDLTLAQLYRRGIIMNVTNPKVSIFFLAFLPQFTNPSLGSIPMQVFMLGAIFMLCALVIFTTIALLAGKLGTWFNQSPKAEGVLNKLAGSVFAALAVKLALTQR